MKVTFENNFDFEKTYSEYGFNLNYEQYKDDVEKIVMGVEQIHFLHNCMVLKTKHFGESVNTLTYLQEKFGALNVTISVFSPYIESDNSHGLFLNIFFAENCTAPKYPK